MQNSSFDSLNLDEYTLDIQEVLEDYVLEKGNLLFPCFLISKFLKDVFKVNYSVHYGTMKNSSQKVKIYRRLFPTDPKSKERFQNLMTAFNNGIVLADNIFLSYENQGKQYFQSLQISKNNLEYYLYIVEPWFTNGHESKFIPMSHVLQSKVSNAKKHKLFHNLVVIVKKPT